MVVERCIGLLKGRFRKLKTLMAVDKLDDVPEIVVCACILHNICIVDDDIEDFLDDAIMMMMMIMTIFSQQALLATAPLSANFTLFNPVEMGAHPMVEVEEFKKY